ncbi:GspH/FimT family pseudopilin [Arenimonas daejeonensis]|uniref:GspH/FimT family pseudopilin n=1 Tax=Arenimonas daejeonensis TaxID=370777 RepID=UPI0011BD50A0|nr:GspH/FimT family pseudopilin [Arenimonas daejeonensis]
MAGLALTWPSKFRGKGLWDASNLPSDTLGVGRGLRSAGFTLVELMITIAVLAVVLAVAVPSFQGVINRNRLVSAANEAVGVLQIARMEAIRRNARVEICPSTNGAACSGSNWARMIVRVASSGEVVRDVQVVGQGISVKGSENAATNNRIAFSSDGFARVGSGTATSGGLSVCSSKLPDAENTRDVLVAVSRVSVTARNGTAACTAADD